MKLAVTNGHFYPHVNLGTFLFPNVSRLAFDLWPTRMCFVAL